MENKTCRQCQAKFTVTEDDLVFLDKISPEFADKKYQIPPPTLCHECRETRRLNWRNERNLYKRKCDLTGEDIVSVYSPDKPYKVYSNSAWKSDKWDPLSLGREYDENKSFFEQFNELLIKVPRQANNSVFNENCDYCNQTWHSKDSYMSFNLGYGERCFYANESFYVKDVIDCFDVRNCEYCYLIFDCDNCNNCRYLDHCKNCSEVYFSYDCHGCHNVFLCSNQKNKEFMIRNKQLSEEEYKKEIKKYDFGSRTKTNELLEEFEKIKSQAIHRENNSIKAENCTGDYILESKDCRDCYNIFKSQNCVRVSNCDDAGKDCRDQNYIAEAELCYEGVSIAGYKNVCCAFMPYGNDNYYCNFCENCKNCFGCFGLTRKEFCVLNKQYSKEDYESLAAKIINKMTADGEWGEYLPARISPFAYNESVAIEYYPKSKEQSRAVGAYWQDNDYEAGFKGEFYAPKDNIEDYVQSEGEVDKLLGAVIKCEKTGRPFKIMPHELAFYMKNKIPVPTVHYRERFMQLFAKRSPRKLYHRQCMCEGDRDQHHGHDHSGRCPVEFETTYAPDRPEKIYCEKCYQKSVI